MKTDSLLLIHCLILLKTNWLLKIMKFGILGAANIAIKVSKAIHLSEVSSVVAIASRDIEKSKKLIDGSKIPLDEDFFINNYRKKYKVVCPSNLDTNSIYIEYPRDKYTNFSGIRFYNTGCVNEFILNNSKIENIIELNFKTNSSQKPQLFLIHSYGKTLLDGITNNGKLTFKLPLIYAKKTGKIDWFLVLDGENKLQGFL